MAQETSKATKRRSLSSGFWDHVFGSFVVDVGSGDDPLVWANAHVTPFDKKDGDANRIDEYFNHPLQNMPTCVHGSQVMEHLNNPTDFMKRCLKMVRPGGHVVMSVPCVDHYERCIMPSRFNPEHQTTWSLWRKTAPTKFPHIYVPLWIKQFDAAWRKAYLVNTNFDYLAPEEKDQSWLLSDGVECWIEMILAKP